MTQHLMWALAVAATLPAQERPAGHQITSSDSIRLPVKRVVLYKSGVGYFEHLGSVRDNQEVSVGFTSGQLNDVLKSLTVLDLGGGRITSVNYGSVAPLERRVGDLQLSLGERTTLMEVFGTLRGARLEVRNGTAVTTGRLLNAERKPRVAGGVNTDVDYISLVGDAGELRTIELSPAVSVRILSRALGGKLNRYLDLLASTHDADLRRVVVSTAGSGERRLFLSYVSEVPVWKTTYRIVLPPNPAEKPLLQGWAIVDNTVGEDWTGVQLSLVSGAPQSFVQKLSLPYYARRPEIALPQSYLMAPQTHQATLLAGGARLAGMVADPGGTPVAQASVRVVDASGNLVAETTTNTSGHYQFNALPEGDMRVDVDLPGFRRGSATVTISASRMATADVRLEAGGSSTVTEVVAPVSRIETATAEVARRKGNTGSGSALGSSSNERFNRSLPLQGGAGVGPGISASSVADARARAEAASIGQQLGDLFEYKLKEPITIRKNQSAMVPVVHANVTAEKVSIWNQASGASRPQRALWLENTSGLTLDGGSFTILEDAAFAGEGIFDSIRPAEKRLVSYAADVAITPGARQQTEPRRVTRVRIARGLMIQESELRENTTYTFRNEDAGPRSVIVEHPVRAGYELRGNARPVEITPAWMRFRLPVAAKQTDSLSIEESRPMGATFTISSISHGQLGVFVRERSIPKPVEEALRRLLAQEDAAAALEAEVELRDQEMQKIFDDQERLRENLKSLNNSAEEKALVQRYMRQLSDQENRLDALKRERDELERKAHAARKEMDQAIEEWTFEGQV